jgi:hypothetical protein
VFPVSYGLNFYILFRINSLFKGLKLDSTIPQYQLEKLETLSLGFETLLRSL